jgi:hypothetical protein
MPPMPPDPGEVEARASAVLRTLRLAWDLVREGGLLGLAPEGRDTPELMGAAPPGAGAFIGRLVMLGMPVLPIAVCEHEGRLTVGIGPVFVPEIPEDRWARDQVVMDQVSNAIKAQLPSVG